MLKLGIVGCGNAASRHADALAQLDDEIQIAGCCDLDSMALMDFRKRYCPTADVYTDVNAMVMQQRFDVLLLASWPVVHGDQIVKAIEAGISTIIVEKPLTISAGEAMELFTLAQVRGVLIMESNAFMYQSRLAELNTMMTVEVPVETMHATFCQVDPEEVDPSAFDLEWRQHKLYGGGVPWEYVSFLVTCCNHYAQDLPVGVYAHGSRGRYDTITRMHGMIEYLNGAVAFIHSDKQSDVQDFRLHMRGTTVDVHDDCWYLNGGRASMGVRTHGHFEDRSIDGNDAFLEQWRAFLGCIHNGAQPAVSFIHSVMAMYTLDALVTSLNQQLSIDLDVPEPILAAYEDSLKGSTP